MPQVIASFQDDVFLCFGEELPPSVNGVYRIGKGRIYKPMKVSNWKTAFCDAVAKIGSDIPLFSQGDLYVLFAWWNDKADVDNRLKPALDAMQGTVFFNDNLIKSLLSHKVSDGEGFLFYVSPKPFLYSLLLLDRFTRPEDLYKYLKEGVLSR